MPTLYQASGGYERLREMTESFYAKAVADDVLGAMFTAAASEHARWLAGWMSVSFGGPRDYVEERGDLRFVIWQHAGLKFTEAQRARWAELMLTSAREVAMPAAFMPGFTQYVEVITRSVAEQSHMSLPEMRVMLGYPEGFTPTPASG
ncbi:hypothetical protein [uncultured Jannaschia sp.]|uniref:globin domain-containing protein n=1 Tax=uncultured Jannaschia sp. TaxID=293347 RepID=UPI0026228089|nr:hypothetical protein [uncultured Jannaschia sp.]